MYVLLFIIYYYFIYCIILNSLLFGINQNVFCKKGHVVCIIILKHSVLRKFRSLYHDDIILVILPLKNFLHYALLIPQSPLAKPL